MKFICLFALLVTMQRLEIYVVAVSGRVTVEDGSALPVSRVFAPGTSDAPSMVRLRVQVAGTSGTVRSVSVKRDGAFIVTFDAAGDYTVTPEILPLGYYVKSIRHGTVDLSRSPLIVTQESGSTELQIVLTTTPPTGESTGVKISGRVIGVSLPGTPLRLSLQSFTLVNQVMMLRIGETQTTNVGSFEFTGVPPGRYSIEAPHIRNPLETLDVVERDILDLELRLQDPIGAQEAILISSGASLPPVRSLPTPVTVPPPPVVSPPAGSGSLSVSQSGRDTGLRHGALSFFRIERSGTRVEEKVLDGSSAITLTPGSYELRTWDRACLESCNRLGPPQNECVAPFTVAAGQTLHADRRVLGASCEIRFQPR